MILCKHLRASRHTRYLRAGARDGASFSRRLRRLPSRARTPPLDAARRLLRRAPLPHAQRRPLESESRARRGRRCAAQ